MIFYDQFMNRPPADEEKNSGESLVESAGYIPAEIQIMEMIQAGERLGEYRKEKYDYESLSEDDGLVDPTRCPGFDMAEASLLDRRLAAKFEQAEKEEKEKKSAELAEKEVKEKEKENGVP